MSIFGGGARMSAVLLLAAALGLSVLGGCAKKTPPVEMPKVTRPPVSVAESPEFFVSQLDPRTQEMSAWEDLRPTIRKSLAYTAKKPANMVAIDRPGLRLTWGEMHDTLQELDDVLPELRDKPGLFIEKFRWVPIVGGIKYSGYYEPVLKASRTAKPGLIPLYALPPDIKAYKAAHGGRYYSRAEIDGQGKLAGRGLELAWADKVDVFFLQIQGSGKLVFEDGTEQYVNYAGQNGHKYIASGRIMRAHGCGLARYDILEQREWFKAHPERIDEILYDNGSYVFFKYGKGGSVGSMGRTIKDWLSLATDPSFIPLGSVVAYGVNAPDPEDGRIALRGIGFAQDTGGAIKRDRIDIFCGSTERSNYVASKLDAKGPAWVLVLR